jgi:hypothetical protein
MQMGLYALEWGERIRFLGGTSETAGCAAREGKHLAHRLPECASLINVWGQGQGRERSVRAPGLLPCLQPSIPRGIAAPDARLTGKSTNLPSWVLPISLSPTRCYRRHPDSACRCIEDPLKWHARSSTVQSRSQPPLEGRRTSTDMLIRQN